MPSLTSETWSILLLSLQVSGSAILISAVVGIPLGTYLGLSRFAFNPVLAALVYTGMAMPPVVVGLVLYLLLSRSGPLGFAGWLLTPRAMVVAQVILGLPFVTGITMTTVSAVPAEMLLQIRSLGASRWQARLTVLREARHGVLLALVAGFGRSISEVGAVWIVGGNIKGHTRVLTTAIVLETRQGHFALALILGAVLLALAMVANVVILRLYGSRLLP